MQKARIRIKQICFFFFFFFCNKNANVSRMFSVQNFYWICLRWMLWHYNMLFFSHLTFFLMRFKLVFYCIRCFTCFMFIFADQWPSLTSPVHKTYVFVHTQNNDVNNANDVYVCTLEYKLVRFSNSSSLLLSHRK